MPAILLVAALSSIAIQPLDSGRFQLTIIVRSQSLESITDGQLKLIAAARRLCRGKGQAVSEGTLEVNKVPRTDRALRKRGDMSMAEVYRCVPEAQ